MRKSIILFVALFLMATAANAASDRSVKIKEMRSEKRVALVIGNADYKSSPLRNPVNDARLVAKTLKSIGFEVITLENASQKQMKMAIDEFGQKIRGGGVGLFYYAGHGMQVNGRNYLIPVGAQINSENEVDYESVDAGRVLAKMETAGNRVNIVIMDACRDNPFARSFRSGSRGLATVDAPKGSFIAYATAPGSVAADGSGNNGIFTEEFVKAVQSESAEIDRVFKQVRSAVLKRTGDKQTTWQSSSLTGDFYFKLPTGDEAMPKPSGEDFKIGDLEKNAQQVENNKAEWNKRLKAMKDAFGKAKSFDKGGAAASGKAEAWKRFLSAFGDDNPYSSEDDSMRSEAEQRITHWEAKAEQKVAMGPKVKENDNSLSRGLVAYYLFNGNANDESGNGNHGTVHGAKLTTDRFGNANRAYSFNGANDYIRVQNSDTLDLVNDFSIGFWIKPNRPHIGMILNKHFTGSNNDGSWFLCFRDDNKIYFQASPNFNGDTHSNAIDISVWNSVLFVYSTLDNSWRFFINGKLNNSGKTLFNVRHTSSDLYIGSEGQYGNYFNGTMDDIRIYNRALSESEIQALYQLRK